MNIMGAKRLLHKSSLAAAAAISAPRYASFLKPKFSKSHRQIYVMDIGLQRHKLV